MPDLGAADLILGFLLLITPVVFIHELGHYWVARKAGVVVDVFSVGFGPEIYGWTAKTPTAPPFFSLLRDTGQRGLPVLSPPLLPPSLSLSPLPPSSLPCSCTHARNSWAS